MYYVIKRQSSPSQCFMGFKVPKYIAAKNSENVIFEFETNGKINRKWIKKEDIILLTKDKAFFIKTMDSFKAVEKEQQTLVNEAKKELELSMETFTETVNAQLDDFEKNKHQDDIPCMLKNL